MRLAIYVHVPEKDGPGGAQDQIEKMQAMAARDGWEVAAVYSDIVSPGEELRPHYLQMISDAEQHLFDALFFWTLESLSPHNAGQTLSLLHRFSEWGICFCSYKEHHLNTCHILRDPVISIIATLAHQDRVYIGHRTRIGLAKQQQTKRPGATGRTGPGRPKKKFDEEKARALHAAHASYAQIVAACGVSKATISRFFKGSGQ